MFTDPIKNLKMLHVKETDIVGDLGAGTGFYAIPAAKMAERGKVYAVELGRDLVQTIQNKVKEEKLNNIECLWGDLEKMGGTKLADGVLDKAIVSNVFFQLEDKKTFMNELARILKLKGEVLFVDWSENSVLAHKHLLVPKQKALSMFEHHGFKLEREIDAGEHHYGMIFIKNER